MSATRTQARRRTSGKRTSNGGSGRQRPVAARKDLGGRRGWGSWPLAFGAVLLLGILVGAVMVINKRVESPVIPAMPTSPRVDSQGRGSAPPWPAPTDVAAAVQAAGLPMLGAEGAVVHLHAHLDVIADGQPVPVPAGIGVDNANHKISPLHTHENDAVIHVESPVQAQFTLGQFLTEWQVSVGADHLGGLRVGDGKQLRAYVNGQPVDGDPSTIILAEHQEIALVYGTAAQHANPPATYAFAAGE